MNTQIVDASRNASFGYRVDVSRGERIGRVSSEWFCRPADELSVTQRIGLHDARLPGPQPDARGRQRAHPCRGERY